MQRNADRLSQLIGQLLDLSKLESGKFKLCIAFANPGDFLRAVASSFSSWAEQKEIKLHVDISKRNESVYFDEEVLQKIIDNLLSNAIKFSPTQGTVSLSAEWNSEALTIHVGDEGPGIPPSKVSLIFERFYQVDDSASRKQEGSGIGLALVKELVALHHGRISVQSKPETGTVFTLVVPVNKERYASSEIRGSEAKSVQHSPAIGNGRTPLHADPPEPEGARPLILVVEDNADLASYIGNHLPGYDVVFAANGLEGLDKAIGQVPDLIVSDVMMPEMDGIALCHNIKTEEKTSHIPFILLTAKADMGSRLEGLETGADDYMTKPFDARELQTRVRNLIQQREILRGRFSRTVILKPKDIAITSPDEVFLEKVMAIIEGHLDDSEFTVDDFQREIGMSRMQLHRKLKALTGQSAGEFVRTQRLIRASEILTKTDNNISEVCYQTGFTSLSYFAKCFKKQFGTTPKDYAAMHAQPGTHSR